MTVSEGGGWSVISLDPQLWLCRVVFDAGAAVSVGVVAWFAAASSMYPMLGRKSALKKGWGLRV